MFDIPYLQLGQIHQAANTFLADHWDGQLWVDIERIAEEKLGLELIPNDFLKQQMDVEAMLLSNGREIVWSTNSPDVRIRFSIAHEIGHHVLHAPLVEQ